jgi:redox-sensitive bicupin YhaK (pirin superfamily)
MAPTIDLRPAGSRMHTRIGWLDSWHSFSFGRHFDPDNTHFGLLLVSNDDRVTPGAGFGTHPHRDMEIVTWVLEGALAHRDSAGNEGVIRPGEAQRMSAGTGILHSEMNASADEPVHLVQMWVPPDTTGLAPGYEQAPVDDALGRGGLVEVASAGGDSAVHIHQSGARLWAARPGPGASVTVPGDRHVHVFVALGGATLATADGPLELRAGDAARLSDHGAADLTGGTDGAEVLVWATE